MAASAVSVGMYKPTADGKSSQQLTPEESELYDGSTIPANIWLDFMKVVTDNMEVQDFPARAGVGDDKIPTPTTTFTPPPTTTSEAPTTTTTQPPATTGDHDHGDAEYPGSRDGSRTIER